MSRNLLFSDNHFIPNDEHHKKISDHRIDMNKATISHFSEQKHNDYDVNLLQSEILNKRRQLDDELNSLKNYFNLK